MGNTSQSGRGFRGQYDDWHYFELLPPTARKALREAAFNWSAGWLYGLWNRGELKTGADVAARIELADALQTARDRKRVWGIDDRVSCDPARKPSRRGHSRRRESPR
jgi:Family of unknown function (DUF6525)